MSRKKSNPINLLSAFPLLALPVLVYNVMAFSSSGQGCPELAGRPLSPLVCSLDAPLLQIPMAATIAGPDGALERVLWVLSTGDLLLVFAIVMLFAELLKATKTHSSSIINHSLSLLLFVAGLVEFLLFSSFATSIFFLILMMTLLDALAGFILSIASSRRDVSFS